MTDSPARNVLEEEWDWMSEGGEIWWCDPDDSGADTIIGTMDPPDRAAVAACAPEALKLLLDSLDIENMCVWCGEHKRTMPPNDELEILHEADCRLVALLRKAGLRT